MPNSDDENAALRSFLEAQQMIEEHRRRETRQNWGIVAFVVGLGAFLLWAYVASRPAEAPPSPRTTYPTGQYQTPARTQDPRANDSDGDGISNIADPHPSDADWDDDGVKDGIDPSVPDPYPGSQTNDERP
ncbi:hypothetical protein H7I41_28505 [Mycobacterium manitobense]|uniref:Uncharacterized protein n=1 Tax=[Mycobacterium] manitobense TaxID=190147 RepID=A0A9X2YT57_9MYCO|nr:hypothetical protein [[Mycobacterium] manitobense]MCV7173870.1 hypothetical protein [[Mycobacterium] manitobense]